MGIRNLWSFPTAVMSGLPALCIVLFMPLAPKREVPGSTSGKFAYTETGIPWSPPAARMPVLPAPCNVSIPLAPKRDIPASTSGRFAYTVDPDSLVSS
jgi:hypothetical protein